MQALTDKYLNTIALVILMTLESKLKNSRNSENDKKEILYLDSWPKTVCFAIGTAVSGGDPDVGRQGNRISFYELRILSK